MDAKLLAWSRAVKARQAKRGRTHPVLWFFTDENRVPDPLPAITQLPKGLAGVVFRHDHAPDREDLGRRVALLCRQRRLALSVAGDGHLARRLRAGVHLRGGRGMTRARLVTSSAHSVRELVRAWRNGADLCFLSPVFPTKSHPHARVLGPVRWAAIARHAGGMPILALGGISGRVCRALPPSCRGAAAIGALAGHSGLVLTLGGCPPPCLGALG
ncbi:MAG: thiamine phosphate synthase [Acetobacteraceae bacterium]|nr:thiamine phosphate synthase [Acetobacteraceae bacterium]